MSVSCTHEQKVKEVRLNPGEFFFGAGKIRIQTLLGSCVAMTFWHPKKRIGGMCHYLLPERRGNKKWSKGAFADECLELFMQEITKAHTVPSDYEVKLFGGSTMFAPKPKTHKTNLVSLSGKENNISKTNIEAGFALLNKHHLKVKTSDVGGFVHRTIFLELWNGDVWVKRERSR